MKKPLLLGITGITLVALTATTIYAQVANTSIVDRMKAAVHAFTLSADLNAGQTGYESAPVSGKKTGDILTAGEWNRVLELVAEGSSAGSVNYLQLTTPNSVTFTEGGKVPFTTLVSQKGSKITQNGGEITLKGGSSYRISADLRLTSANSGIGYTIVEKSSGTGVGVFGANYTGTYTGTWGGTSALAVVSPTVDTTYFIKTSSLSGGPYSTSGGGHFTVEELGGGGGSTSSGWVDVPLTDTTPFDKTCEYRFTINTNGDNASIGGTNPIFYAAAVDPFAITYVSHSSVISHILASSKNVFRNNGTSVYTVTKIEKLCGGGSGGSSSELQLSNESPTTAPNFIEATKYCKNLTEGGYSDWRFPNLSELFVFAPISTDTNFLWTNAVDYSQGTANANPGYWGKLRMSDGYFSATSGPGDDVAYVRCVRGS